MSQAQLLRVDSYEIDSANRRRLSPSWLAGVLRLIGENALSPADERGPTPSHLLIEWKMRDDDSQLHQITSVLALVMDTFWKRLQLVVRFERSFQNSKIWILDPTKKTDERFLDLFLPGFQEMKEALVTEHQKRSEYLMQLAGTDGAIRYSNAQSLEAQPYQTTIVGLGCAELGPLAIPTQAEFLQRLRPVVATRLLLEALYRRASNVVDENKESVQEAADVLAQQNDQYLSYYSKLFFGAEQDDVARAFLEFIRAPFEELPSANAEQDQAPDLLLGDEKYDTSAPPSDSWSRWFSFFKDIGVTTAISPGAGIFSERGYLAFIVAVESGRQVVVLVRPRTDQSSDAIYLYGYGEGWCASEIDWTSATQAKRKQDARSSAFPYIGIRYRSKHVERNLRSFFKEN